MNSYSTVCGALRIIFLSHGRRPKDARREAGRDGLLHPCLQPTPIARPDVNKSGVYGVCTKFEQSPRLATQIHREQGADFFRHVKRQQEASLVGQRVCGV
jgi:hypothetical protein